MTEQQLRRLRADFPILATRVGSEPLIYFDNASTTQKPRATIDALTHFYRRQNANVHRGAYQLAAQATNAFESARKTVAQWLNVPTHSIIWTRGATESINLVSHAWLAPRLKAGDRILLTRSNHHANIVPWQQIAKTAGAHLDILELTESGELDLEQYSQLLARQPKMVALTHVSNALGSIYPVDYLVAQAKSAGAWTLVDGAQATPHFNVDLRSLDCDFYLFSGHKTFGPTGIGLLYGRPQLLEEMAPWQTGGEMIESVSFEESRFAPVPLRFEAGTPNIAGAIGLQAAINYLQSQDRQLLETHEQELFAVLSDGLNSLPDIRMLPSGPKTVSLVSCAFKDHQVQDVATFLDAKGFALRAGHHCAQPLMKALGVESSLRISLAFYNSETEVIKLIEVLDQYLSNTQVNLGGNSEVSLEKVYQATEWQARFTALMHLADSLPTRANDLRTPQWEIEGCATRTWMRLTENSDGTLKLETDAQSRIMKALLFLIEKRVDGHRSDQVIPTVIRQELIDLGFESQLSQTRGNAILILLGHLESLISKR